MIRALTFDTYGTVVDWRTSVLRELEALGGRKALAVDWVRFLDDWKAAYRPGMDKVNRGESPWTTVDGIASSLRKTRAATSLGLRYIGRPLTSSVSRRGR